MKHPNNTTQNQWETVGCAQHKYRIARALGLVKHIRSKSHQCGWEKRDIDGSNLPYETPAHIARIIPIKFINPYAAFIALSFLKLV
jgi:hypothetical protein